MVRSNCYHWKHRRGRVPTNPHIREANEQLAAAVAQHPDRFQAWAAIPTPDPAAAVEELEYAVTRLGLRGAMLYGRTGEDLADHPAFDDLYAAAERLRVPLHFHPQTPTQPVIDAHYSGWWYERARD